MKMADLNENFPWGLVVKDHAIGPYVIREYHPRKRRGSEVLRTIDETATEFHGYIDGKDTHEGWATLEDAMVGLIVRKLVGVNSGKINYHFMAGLRAMATD
jgi:hypothetical protein